MKNSLFAVLVVMVASFVGCTTLEERVELTPAEEPVRLVTTPEGVMNRNQFRKWLKTAPWSALENGITDQDPIVRAYSASEIYSRYKLDSLRHLSLLVEDSDELVADTLLECGIAFRHYNRVRDLLRLLADNSPVERVKHLAKQELGE